MFPSSTGEVTPFIFLHIEKTSATSIRKSVIEPNLPCVPVGQVRGSVARRGHPRPACYHGHVPHGFHHVLGIQPRYVTALRSPVDRAVSFYYFVRDLQRTDIWERHPLRDYADSVTVAQFYENPRFANIQTRRLAGFEFDRLYPRLHASAAFRRAMLAAAKRHLDEMPVFGILEHFEESRRRFLEFTGGRESVDGLREKATKHRCSVAELRAIRPVVIERIERAHELDRALYTYALDRFAADGPPRADSVDRVISKDLLVAKP